MNALILETSSNHSCLILASDGKPLSFLPLEGGRELSKQLGLRVEETLRAHPCFRADFVAVGTGPGSYTGIRVGVAMAKALAFGWNIPLLGFCSLQAFCPSSLGSFAILVDARMGGFYCLKGTRTDCAVSFEEPLLLQEEALPSLPLFSPHPEDLFQRGLLAQPILEALINSDFLSRLCSEKASHSLSPLASFPLSYLSHLS